VSDLTDAIDNFFNKLKYKITILPNSKN